MNYRSLAEKQIKNVFVKIVNPPKNVILNYKTVMPQRKINKVNSNVTSI